MLSKNILYLYSDSELRPTSAVAEESAITQMEDNVPQESDGVSASDTPIDHDTYEPGLDVANFLKRPVRIYTARWQVNDFLRETIDPWSLFLNTPSIKAKTRNYAYFRGTLKVKVQINGNAFYYGRAMLSYSPFGYQDRDVPRVPGEAPGVDNMAFSQRPHVILNPTESQAGELTLPFYWPFPRASMSTNLGQLTLTSFNRLAHANASVDPVSITIMAWFDDIELTGATALVSDSKKGSKGKSDEYGEGSISKPAAALAKAAGIMAVIPGITPMATATMMAATAVSQVAALYGYCRPIVLTPINKFRACPMGNMANATIDEAVDKLTFDPKQELTIDPRVTGAPDGTDELTLSTFLTKEAYLTRFRWQTADATDKLLFSSRVTPNMFTSNTATPSGTREMHTTPVFYGTAPFHYWRGSMTFRFVVAASNFHRGRLRIVYDPKGTHDDYGVIPPDFAAVYTRIVDISECKEFELTIGWQQPEAYQEVRSYSGNQSDIPFSPETDIGSTQVISMPNQNEADNGVLNIYVLNDLTRPNDGDPNSPEINVFVRGGDDLSVAEPTERKIARYSRYPLVNPVNLLSDSGQGEPLQMDAKVVLDPIGSMADHNEENLIYFGEVFESFRYLLKRYQLSYTTTNPALVAGATRGLWKVVRKNFPLYRGYNPQSQTSSGSVPYTYTKNTLINWLTPCYVARRGGLRWKYNLIKRKQTYSGLDEFTVSRLTGSVFQSNELLDTKGEESLEISLRPSNWEGAYSTNIATMPTAEVEVPFYSNLKFESCSAKHDHEKGQCHSTLLTVGDIDPNIAGDCRINGYVATGEDFNLIWFINTPVMYIYNDAQI